MNAPNEFKVRQLKAMVQLRGRKRQKPILLVQGNITCLFVCLFWPLSTKAGWYSPITVSITCPCYLTVVSEGKTLCNQKGPSHSPRKLSLESILRRSFHCCGTERYIFSL